MMEQVAWPVSRTRIAVLAACVFLVSACGQPDAEPDEEAMAQAESIESAPQGEVENMEAITELQIIDIVEGDGATAEPGKQIVVHYTGWLYDPSQPENKGQKFDSSVDRGDPFVFPLGAGRVIRGWDEGFAGMQIGGKRILIIPSDMAYGERGAGGVIPPNATLLFEVELLELQ